MSSASNLATAESKNYVILVDLSVRTLEDLNSYFEDFPFWSKVRISAVSEKAMHSIMRSYMRVLLDSYRVQDTAIIILSLSSANIVVLQLTTKLFTVTFSSVFEENRGVKAKFGRR